MHLCVSDNVLGRNNKGVVFWSIARFNEDPSTRNSCLAIQRMSITPVLSQGITMF